MNAEYTHSGKVAQFTVMPEDGAAPFSVTVIERSTCGKYILSRTLVFEHYDAARDVAIYSLIGTGKRPV